MLYITIIFALLFLIAAYKIAVSHDGVRLYDFDLRETLPLRGILAVCVFLTHLCPHLDEASPWLEDFGMWGPPSVACFFLLAGYGLAYSVKIKGPAYLDGFFRKRLSKLVWPFLIMAIIYQTWRIYNGIFDWKQLLVEPSPLSWFIYALFIWYVGFYICFKGVKDYRSGILRIWLFTAIYMFWTVSQEMGYYWISILPMPMAITYVFYEEKTKKFIQQHPYLSLSVVGGMFVMMMGYTLYGIYVHHLPGWGPLVYTTLPIWVVLLIYMLGGARNIVINFLGRISYEIYIVHGFIVMLLADIILIDNQNVNSVFVILLLFGVTVIGAWGLNGICKILHEYLFPPLQR